MTYQGARGLGWEVFRRGWVSEDRCICGRVGLGFIWGGSELKGTLKYLEGVIRRADSCNLAIRTASAILLGLNCRT